MYKAFISLGSNIEDRKKHIRNSIDLFLSDERIKLIKISSFYESSPYGYKEQNNFLNLCVSFNVFCELHDFFDPTKEIENKVGRTKTFRWGPREIDIDILYFNDMIINEKELIIPHKEILLRDFVMIPLLEIEPEIIHIPSGIKLREYLPKLKTKTIIGKIDFGL